MKKIINFVSVLLFGVVFFAAVQFMFTSYSTETITAKTEIVLSID